MKLIKILMFVILGSLCLGSVFALEGDESGLEAWYPLENNATDMSINNNDGTNNGVTFNGQYGDFDENDYISLPNFNTNDFDGTKNFSINMRINPDSIANNQYLFALRNQREIDIRTTNTGEISFRINIGNIVSINNINTSQWINITARYDSSNGMAIYLNGNLQDSNSFTGTINSESNSNENAIGSLRNGAGYFNGKINNTQIWTKALSNEEISNLNECNALNCYSTPTISADVQDFYPTKNISINLTTNPVQNTNMSYLLDNMSATPTSICNNCNNSQLNLTNLNEGSHSIEFVSTNQGGQVNSSYNFTIDLTPPGINESFPTNLSSYDLGNASQYLNCSDIGNGSCTIEFTDDNATINYTENYTFNENGNQSYVITATDDAGNTAIQTGTIFVNPEQYIYFETPGNSPISNFTLGGTNYQDYATIQVYDLGLGNHNLKFSKLGYQDKNISLEFNKTSRINTTKTIKVALLHINIRDRESKSLITQNVDIRLIGEKYASNYSTSSGQLTINDIKDLPGEYRLEFTSNGYSNNEYYFTHTGFSAVNITTYMINSSKTLPIQVVVRDVYSSDIPGCLVTAKQYFIGSNSYEQVDQGVTNSNGEVIFDLQDEKYYQFVVECDGEVQTEPGQKITSNILRIRFGTGDQEGLFSSINNVVGDITFQNLSNTTGYFKFEYTDKDNIASQGCLRVYEDKFQGDVLLNSSCVNSASATINVNVPFQNGKTYVAKGYITKDGTEHYVDSLTKRFIPGDGAWNNGFGLWASLLIIATLFLIGIAMHPFAGIAFAWVGAFTAVKFGALQIPIGVLLGLGALLVGVLIFRGDQQ